MNGSGVLSQADAERLVAAGQEVCPYSRAIRANMDVTLKATAV